MPYIFIIGAIAFINLWSDKNAVSTKSNLSRAIANDCQSLIQEIIVADIKKENGEKTLDPILKFRKNIWNKIISTKDFEQFSDVQYVRSLEIYKDSKDHVTTINPISIEQKLALIEIINSRLINNLGNNEEIQKLNAFKLKKLQSLLNNFDLSSKLTREDLAEFSSEFFLILKGPPISLLDYFTKNKSARMNERLMRVLQEDMLVFGLKGMLDRIPERNMYSRLERGKYLANKFFQYKIWRYLVMPYDLPWFDQVKIPEELLQKILLEGLDAHDQELISILKKQNMIDHYERFRKIYKPIAFSFGFYFYYDRFNSKLDSDLNEEQEEEKKKLIDAFTNLAESVTSNTVVEIKTDEDLKNEQLKRVIESYKKRYGQDPTSAEIEELKSRIHNN